MIMVEIEIPMMGKEYDFQIDEDRFLRDVQEEVMELVCQKEQCPLKGKKERLMMWDAQRRIQLQGSQTALESGLKTGSRILLA